MIAGGWEEVGRVAAKLLCEARGVGGRGTSGSAGRPRSSLLNRPGGDWPHESRSSLYLPNGGRRRREEAVGRGGRSVNFILPQLRARQGERTSLAPRPHRPTFLFYGPPRGKETDLCLSITAPRAESSSRVQARARHGRWEGGQGERTWKRLEPDGDG